jgi:hypothetical protein
MFRSYIPIFLITSDQSPMSSLSQEIYNLNFLTTIPHCANVCKKDVPMMYHIGPRKVFTDEIFQLDVGKLHKGRRLGKLGARLHVSWNSEVWRYGVHMESSIGVEIVALNELALRYDVTNPDGRRESVLQEIALTWQPLHFGGHRPWFSCPDCGRRTAIFHAGNGASRFACRKCYNLAYRVESESVSDRWGRRQQRLWKLLGRDLAAEDGRWRVTPSSWPGERATGLSEGDGVEGERPAACLGKAPPYALADLRPGS